MSRNEHLRIVIAEDGTCTVDAMNFVCLAYRVVTDEITAALGGQIDHQCD